MTDNHIYYAICLRAGSRGGGGGGGGGGVQCASLLYCICLFNYHDFNRGHRQPSTELDPRPNCGPQVRALYLDPGILTKKIQNGDS